MKKQLLRWAGLLAAAVLMCNPVPLAQAGTDWLNQGTKLLDSMNSGGGSGTTGSVAGLSTTEITAGLKQALEKGAVAVVNQLSAQNGFNLDSNIHIPLPDSLASVKSLLSSAGFGGLADDVELKLNRAAEAATPKAKSLFLDAITQMSFDDAKSILNGADDAATRYFKEKMSPGLTAAMTPVVDDTLAQVGAVQAYDTMIGQYKGLPFVPDVKANLTAHTVQKAMDGIFYYLAREEKAIRQDPAKRTTQLLQKVFK